MFSATTARATTRSKVRVPSASTTAASPQPPPTFSTTDLAAIGKALAGDDAKAAHEHCHSLKGGALNLFADGLAAAAKHTETLTLAGRLPEAAASLARVREELRRVELDVERLEKTGQH